MPKPVGLLAKIHKLAISTYFAIALLTAGAFLGFSEDKYETITSICRGS